MAEVIKVRSAMTRAYQIQEADCGIMAMLKIAYCFSAGKISNLRIIEPTVPKPKGR